MDVLTISNPPAVKSSSGLVYSGPCIFHGVLIGTDGVNDPAITLYNNTAASGEEALPTCTYDASLLGLNGATGMRVYCDTGLYLEITCAGACEVSVLYAPMNMKR